MVNPERHKGIWYHGSPYELTELAAGSTITPDRDLARAFSHKPTLVCIDDDGAIRHNGTRTGILYQVDEPLAPGDVYPHPRTTMPEGLEWLTVRPLRLRRLGRARIKREERITEEEIRALVAQRGATGGGEYALAGRTDQNADKSREPH